MKFEGIPEPVFVGVPQRLGWSLETTLLETFSEEEKKGLAEAAKAVFKTYQTAISGIE